MPTYNILVLLLHLNMFLKSSIFGGFSMRFNDNSEVAYFLLFHPSVQLSDSVAVTSYTSRNYRRSV